MKHSTTLIIALAISFIFTSCVVQRGEGAWLMQGDYQLEFTDQVRITIGGATKTQTSSEWQNGSSVGNTQISGELFEQIQAATNDSYNFKIESKGLGDIHKIIAKDLSTGKTTRGTYNYRTRELSFITAKSNNNNSLNTTVVKGKFNADFSSISNGEFQIGWIAGQEPIIINADATFFFNGRKQMSK